jgi:hypothetical protein
MTKFIVTYDLHSPGKDYTKLLDKLRSYGNYGHIQESTWLIFTDGTSLQLARELWQFMDGNDSLYVCEASNSARANLNTTDEWTNQYA